MKTLKVEGVYPMAFESEKDVARHLPRFIDSYNERRLHSATPLRHAGAVSHGGVTQKNGLRQTRCGSAATDSRYRCLYAYRADEIDLDTLKAFAVTADRERQVAVWHRRA